jgi:hypothetical protein
MTFEDILHDIRSLKGMFLQSLGRGSSIMVLNVDYDNERVEIEICSGGKKSGRPFQELQKVWTQLCSKPAVHVDSALAGSGSSRNQPETMFANLPYVEYLYIENRKHLTLMPSGTHKAGTIRLMDGVQAQKVREDFASYGRRRHEPPGVLVLLDNIAEEARALEKAYGMPAKPVLGSPGLYKLYSEDCRILLADTKKVGNLKGPGHYLIVRSKVSPGKKIGIEIDGYDIEILEEDPLIILAAVSK